MGNTLATMLTMTTYGSWLRGDRRGWVDDGIIMPPDPALEEADRRRMKHSIYLFRREQLLDVGRYIGEALTTRQGQLIYAKSVGNWHVHILIGPTRHPIGDVAKCAKDAVRYGLHPGRPIWTEKFDKRFCFDKRTVRNRIHYIERHNEAINWPAAPWPFITVPSYLRPPI
jgi:hypothetical protein